MYTTFSLQTFFRLKFKILKRYKFYIIIIIIIIIITIIIITTLEVFKKSNSLSIFYNYPDHFCKGNIKIPALFETKWVLVVAFKEILYRSFMVFHKQTSRFILVVYDLGWSIINFIPEYV